MSGKIVSLAGVCVLLAGVAVLAAEGGAAGDKVELRGAWVWGRSCSDQDKADKMLARAERMNLNTLYFLSFYDGATVCHQSEMVPMNRRVAEGFDPLAYVLERARAKNMEVHVWFVNGESSGGPIFRENPQWRAMNLVGKRIDWFDFCQPAVRQWQAQLMTEVLENYNVDGVHFDYIRFPRQDVCTCPVCRRQAAAEGIQIGELVYPALPAWGYYEGNPVVKPTTARVLAAFDDGVPAVAVNPIGGGEVILFNWHADRNTPKAIHTAMRRALVRLGATMGKGVCVLDSDVNAERYGSGPYYAGVDLVEALGFRAERVEDDGLADLPTAAVVLLPKHYMMTQRQAAQLLAHVRAGGGAMFLDAPVYAMETEVARELLGFRRVGEYFSGDRLLLPTAAKDNFVPIYRGRRKISRQSERAKGEKWIQWREDQITRLVADVSRRAGRQVTAAVFCTPDGAEAVLQDWPRWLHEGLLDYAVPMAYVESADELKGMLAWWKILDPALTRIVPGIGATRIIRDSPAAEAAELIARQIDLCRQAGARGFVLYNLEGIDDETAAALGRDAITGNPRPYRPPPRILR